MIDSKIKAQVDVRGKDVVSGIRFYGETNANDKVVKRIDELSLFLKDILWELTEVAWSVEDRKEASAIEINDSLKSLRRELLWVMANKDDVEVLKKIINGYSEESEGEF